MPERQNKVDIGRANVEAERFRLLSLLSRAEELHYRVGDLIDELKHNPESARTAQAFLDIFRQLDVGVFHELLRGNGDLALERVAVDLADLRYSAHTNPSDIQLASTPPVGDSWRPKKGAKKKSTKKKAAKKKAAKKKAAKKPPGKRKPRQQNLPQTREPRTKPETVQFDRKVTKLIWAAGNEGVQNDKLMSALDCSKGKLRLSLNRLKGQNYIAQNGERRTARYSITQQGEAFAQDPKEEAL